MGDHYTNVGLPPGFRFQPTDEELVVHFLHRKASLLPCHPDVIPDLHLFPYDPWELQGRALAEGNKWYYYSRRTQDRLTGSGYWKPSGVDEPVLASTNRRVGMKRHLVFYAGEAPEGTKTNWVMHEYRLSGGGSSEPSSSKRKGNAKTVCICYHPPSFTSTPTFCQQSVYSRVTCRTAATGFCAGFTRATATGRTTTAATGSAYLAWTKYSCHWMTLMRSQIREGFIH
ncbi:hypothetical protein SAY86_018651 [Trapa natans]|uniref:NAC domain-containing protein n=1 Tax=Trapa natans TaxID=22666 RepID=A0AAN7LJG0_TRANT|nr:hypothetical protein SAY86_018651 [Trapa natans]